MLFETNSFLVAAQKPAAVRTNVAFKVLWKTLRTIDRTMGLFQCDQRINSQLPCGVICDVTGMSKSTLDKYVKDARLPS